MPQTGSPLLWALICDISAGRVAGGKRATDSRGCWCPDYIDSPSISLVASHNGLESSDERCRINLDLGQDVCQPGICRDPGDAVDVIVD